MQEMETWLPGQPAAARALRAAAGKPVHAYLFVGPPGTGKLTAAKAFAAKLVCTAGAEDDLDCYRRVVSGVHPDVAVFEREGAALTIDQAREIARLAARAPLEAPRTVVVIPDLHLAREAAPALLKTLEDPTGPVVFIGLAEFLPPELVTIASRCVRIDFRPLGEEALVDALVAEGIDREKAQVAARLAGGRLDRARLLARDSAAEKRWLVWASVPGRLDGSGATVALLAGELVELLKESVEPLLARQEAEVAAFADKATARRQVARDLEDRHKREQRRQRTDELRTGLAALAGVYRDQLARGEIGPPKAAQAVALIDQLSEDLAYNPGELLALQALLVRLDRLASS